MGRRCKRLPLGLLWALLPFLPPDLSLSIHVCPNAADNCSTGTLGTFYGVLINMSGSSIQLSRFAIEKNPDHVVMLGMDLTVKEASVTFAEATQGKPGENFTSFLDPFTVTSVDKFFGHLKTGEDVSATCQMHHRVGDRSVPVEYTWVRCDDETGKPVGFFGIGRDSDPRMSSAEGDDMASELEHARSEATRMKHELDSLRRQLDNHSLSDVLTGLGNRRFVMDRLNTELPRAIRYDEPLTVLLMDIDHLSRINDEHGHDLGDTVIREVAEMVRQQVRTTDSVARFDGEEFMVICPHTDLPSSQFLVERLRRRIAEMQFPTSDEDDPVRITVSMGMVTVHKGADYDVEGLLQAAEHALDSAKLGGVNRVQMIQAP